MYIFETRGTPGLHVCKGIPAKSYTYCISDNLGFFWLSCYPVLRLYVVQSRDYMLCLYIT